MSTRTCPDCDVSMTVATHETSGDASKLRVDTVGRDRLFGRLGVAVQAFVCPECGLVRLYATE
jgi:hypothetical protein